MAYRIALAFVVVVQLACSFHSPKASDDAAPGPGPGGTDAPVVSCTEGSSCDDMNACTEYDVCANGACRGTMTSACTGCASTCSATCGGSSCCTQSCPGGTCPTCPAGCSCDLSCGQSRPCNATCAPGAICNVAGTNGETDGAYNVTCGSGSICSVDCTGDEGACALTCSGTASCLLDCRNKRAGSCEIQGCTGTVTNCTGAYAGVKVCNRPCP